MANKCGNCRHWRPYGQRRDPVLGACHVRAYGAIADRHGNENQILRSVFRDYSCREHQWDGIDKPADTEGGA